ncbi:MAG: hypothetical protein DHS20C01_19910 [marine bacterium B5-7]|nr:MAG: hypothetical protein DHS20C01_19910 [marine bacterium B5-7]
MNGKQHNETGLGSLDHQVIGEGESRIKSCLAIKRETEHQEMHGQKQCQGNTRYTMQKESPVRTAIAAIHVTAHDM